MRFSLQELWKLLKGIYAETQNLTGFLRRWAKNLGIASAKESPLRFLMWVATALAGVGAVASLFGMTQTSALEALSQFFWIALTLVFTAFAEAILQSMSETQTKRLRAAHEKLKATLLAEASASAPARIIDAQELKEGDCVLVRAGETIPADGEVLSGIASVDESALTGESAPVIREAGADRNAVTAGTRVLSDYLVIKVLKTSKDATMIVTTQKDAVRLPRMESEVPVCYLRMEIEILDGVANFNEAVQKICFPKDGDGGHTRPMV